VEQMITQFERLLFLSICLWLGTVLSVARS